MPGLKTNEREGTRAVLRHCRMSAYKARQVLDLIRGVEADRALEVLQFSDRDAAKVVGKVLGSALANAEHNEHLDPEELYVSACYADEGTTLKRWRPRARGRATRIRKRTCHVTVIVSRLPEEQLARRHAREAAGAGARRARRVAGTRRAAAAATATAQATAEGAGSEEEDTAGTQEDRGDELAGVAEVEDAAATEEDTAGTQDQPDERDSDEGTNSSEEKGD